MISAAATRRAALVVGYIAAWVVAAFVPIPLNDIDAFFLPSAQQVLAGHPLLAYQPLGQMDYPNANGPLALFPLAAAAALTQALGWMATLPLRRAVILALFSVAVLLMAREGVRAIDRHRDEPLAGGRRLLAYGALAAGPPVWQAVVGYGHVEQPLEAWLVLLAARWVVAERPARAGVSLGLGVLARSTAALFALPLALAAWRRGAAAAGGRKDVPGAAPLPGVARAAAVAGASVATAAAGLLPFFLVDRDDVVHSLVTFRANLPVGAGSIWHLARGTGWEALAQRADMAVVILVVIAVNAWLVTRPGGLTGARLYAALALTAAAFALLAKTVWPYYLFEVYVFTVVWSAGRRPARRLALVAPPAAVAALGLWAEVGVTPGFADGLVRAHDVVSFAALGAGIVAVAWTAGAPQWAPADRG